MLQHLVQLHIVPVDAEILHIIAAAGIIVSSVGSELSGVLAVNEYLIGHT